MTPALSGRRNGAALPPRSPGRRSGSPAPELSRVGERLLDRVAEAEQVAFAERCVLHGLPAERLADLADEEGAYLIVVGSRGGGAFKRAFLGSVSSDVIGLARRPVLVVPPGACAGGADPAEV